MNKKSKKCGDGIIVFSYDYAPKNITSGFRTIRLVKYLAQNQITPYVVTSCTKKATIVQELNRQIPVSARVYRIPWFVENVDGSWGRTINTAAQKGFIGVCFKTIKDILANPDKFMPWVLMCLPLMVYLIIRHRIKVIYASGGPYSLFVGAVVAGWLTHTKVLIDYRDPWSTKPGQEKHTPVRRFFNRFWEGICLKKASLIIANVPQAATDIVRNFKTKTPIQILGNGFDLDDYQAAKTPEPVANQEYTFFYAGKCDVTEVYYHPHIILEVFSKFKAQNPAWPWRLQMAGRFSEETKSIVNNSSIADKIEYLGYLPRQEVLKYEQQADCLIHFYYPEKIRWAQSSKTFEYIMAGKPIISINTKDSDMAELLRTTGTGFSCENDDPDEGVALLEKVYTMDRAAWWEQRNLKEIEKYNVKNQVAQLAELIKAL